MSTPVVPDPAPAPGAPPRRRLRTLFVVLVAVVGMCEALAVMPWMDSTLDVLAWPVAIGFVVFLVLVGPFGNALVAIGLFVLGRCVWRWPAWRCLALAAPFAFVTLRIFPTPW